MCTYNKKKKKKNIYEMLETKKKINQGMETIREIKRRVLVLMLVCVNVLYRK